MGKLYSGYMPDPDSFVCHGCTSYRNKRALVILLLFLALLGALILLPMLFIRQ